MMISSPAYDTINKIVVYPISPKYQHLYSSINILDDTNSEYIRMVCNKPVFPKRGTVNRWHFSHYSDTTCTFHNNESDEHSAAKYKLYELLKNKIPITIKGAKCRNCNSRKEETQIEYTDNDIVKVEYSLENGCRADVTIVDRYIFEIFVTSRTKTKRSDPWFEIHAEEVLDGKTIFKDIKYYQCCEKKYKKPHKYITSSNTSITQHDICKLYVDIRLVREYRDISLYSQWLLEEAVEGKYKLYYEFNSGIKNPEHYLWIIISVNKKCVLCDCKTNGIMYRPYCLDCYRKVQSEKVIWSFWEKVSYERKMKLREQLSWISTLEKYQNDNICKVCNKKCFRPYIRWFGVDYSCCKDCFEIKCDELRIT